MMKNRFLIALAIGLFIFPPLLSLMIPDVEKEIISSLETGDTNKLMAYFAEDINSCDPEGIDYFTAEETYIMLSNFFELHHPEKFKIRHRGENYSGKKSYLIGVLFTSNNDFCFTINILENKITNIIIDQVDSKEYFSFVPKQTI